MDMVVATYFTIGIALVVFRLFNEKYVSDLQFEWDSEVAWREYKKWPPMPAGVFCGVNSLKSVVFALVWPLALAASIERWRGWL